MAEISAFLETNSQELKEIWDKGCELFSSYSGNLDDLLVDDVSFYAYLRSYLLLTADIDGALKLLLNMGELLKLDSSKVRFGTKCLLPCALEYFMKYEKEGNSLKEFFHIINENIPKPNTPIERAYALGAKYTLERLYPILFDGETSILISNEETQAFDAFFDVKEKKYIGEDEITLNLIPTFFGFEQDDGFEVFDRYFKDHSFDVKKSEKLLLFDVLMGESYSNLIYSYVLESGNPKPGSPMSHLSTLIALIEDLVGVDTTMLAKGIESAQNRLPESISYSLTLQNPSGLFELVYEAYEDNYSFTV